MGIGEIIAGIAGLVFICSGLYTVSWLVSNMLAAMASGNIAGVIGLGVLIYVGGAAVVVALLGIGIFLVIGAIDN